MRSCDLVLNISDYYYDYMLEGAGELDEVLMNTSEDNLTTFCPEASNEELDLLILLSFLLEGVLQMVVSCLGIIGNTASVYLLTRQELRSFFHQLLAVLAVFDLLYLLTMMLEALRRIGLESELHTLLIPHLLFPLNSITLTCSIYITVAVAVERYKAVYHPVDYSRLANDASSYTRRLLSYVLPIIILSVIFNLPKFLEVEINIRDGKVFPEVTELRMSNLYVTWYHNWARFLILGIIPFTAITFLNTKIYLAVRRRRKGHRKQEDAMSLVLMIIVATFVVCNSIRLFLNMHEITVIQEMKICRCTDLGGFPTWVLILGFISHTLLVVNSSANIIIYAMFGTKFRQVFHSYLPCPRQPLTSPSRQERRTELMMRNQNQDKDLSQEENADQSQNQK